MPEVVQQAPATPAPVVAPATAPAPSAPRRFEIPAEETKPEAEKTPAEAAPAKDGQNSEAQATSAKPEGEKPETTDKDEPQKQRGQRSYERRLDKAFRRAAEERGRADFLAKQLEELKAKSQPAVASDPASPKLEDFTDIAQYSAAVEKYATEKVQREYEAKQRAEHQRQYQESVASSWEEKSTRGEDKYEDFEAKVGKLDPRIPMNVAIMEAENGDEIAYFLGSNLKEAERILKLSPLGQIREIGKLEAKLLSEPEKPKTPSKAPAPITPLTGAAPVASDVPSEQDDMGAWIRKRQKQKYGARR